MAFPLMFTVGVFRRITDGLDVHGNPVVSYADVENVKVYGWGAPTSLEPKTVGNDRVVVELELLVPASFKVKPVDRVELDGEMYDVVGHVEDYNHGPFGYQPGSVVNLRRVDG